MHGYIARICTSFIDYPDHTSIAIYLSGCSLRCPHCQNKELWEKENGTLMSLDQVLEKVKEHPLADSVVFLGGEPTDQMDFLIALCKKIIAKTDKTIVLYTGREYEVLPHDLLESLSLIVCGPYRQELHVDAWPASTNQRVFKKKAGQWKS